MFQVPNGSDKRLFRLIFWVTSLRVGRAPASRFWRSVASFADQIAILSFGEQLLKLSAQVFHSWDHAPFQPESPPFNLGH
jgi:hypothetical protein